MAYAILLKIHSWDDFVRRRLDAVLRNAGSAEVFLFVDHTKGFVGGIDYPKTIHASEGECLNYGLALQSAGNMFWYCNDYPLLYFYDKFQNFDYYLMIEYDAVANLDLERFIATVESMSVDCVAHSLNTPIAEWHWAASAEGVYPAGTELQNYLFSFAVFSRRAVAHLFDRRRRLSSDLAAGRITRWPQGELFMGTELVSSGYSIRALSDFGSTAHFSWWPPVREGQLSELADGVFFHPVLDDARYVESALRHEADLAAWFDENSVLRSRLAGCSSEIVLPILFHALRKRRRPDLISRLKSEIDLDDQERLHARRNVALKRHATQSSIGPWSIGTDVHRDAEGAINGAITGGYGFHTGYDKNPWWMVDLEVPHTVDEIRVFNRLDVRDRARTLVILTSMSGTQWHFSHVRTDDHDFGGADGNPLVVKFEQPIRARFVRIELPRQTLLHLDEVQIFGEPVAAE